MELSDHDVENRVLFHWKLPPGTWHIIPNNLRHGVLFKVVVSQTSLASIYWMPVAAQAMCVLQGLEGEAEIVWDKGDESQ